MTVQEQHVVEAITVAVQVRSLAAIPERACDSLRDEHRQHALAQHELLVVEVVRGQGEVRAHATREVEDVHDEVDTVAVAVQVTPASAAWKAAQSPSITTGSSPARWRTFGHSSTRRLRGGRALYRADQEVNDVIELFWSLAGHARPDRLK